MVTLVLPAGKALTMPLSALCEDDQQRIRALHGESAAPKFVLDAYRDAAALLARHDRLPEDIKLPGERQRMSDAALALFDSRVSASSMSNLSAAARADAARLRASLRGGSGE
jgi:hypothetical protein